jgi:hypothetical protein
MRRRCLTRGPLCNTKRQTNRVCGLCRNQDLCTIPDVDCASPFHFNFPIRRLGNNPKVNTSPSPATIHGAPAFRIADSSGA